MMRRTTRHSQPAQKKPAVDRLHILTGVFFLFGIGIFIRLFDLQILESQARYEQALGQRSIAEMIDPHRGDVYTISGIHSLDELQPVAVNETRQHLFAVPSDITNPRGTAEKMVEMLGLEEKKLRELETLKEEKPEEYDDAYDEAVDELINDLTKKFSKEDDPYEPIRHEVPQELADQILALELPGIQSKSEIVRNYPLGTSFAHVTGFLGFGADKRIGQYGIEQQYERILSGSAGYIESELDPAGRLIVLAGQQFTPATDGADIVLTVDPNIQQKACELTKNVYEKYEGVGASIIVMEPKTGSIRALCSLPTFDPNDYGNVEGSEVYINNAVSSAFEPGSIFKAITMAAALDSGSVTVDTEYEDTGEVKFDKYTIRNAANKTYGIQTMSGVLENSLNTGMVFAAMQTGKATFYDYIQRFGFGHETGIELPVESEGNISALEKRGDIYLATASFGQGITVTPLQMVQAYGAIANQGKLVQPHIVKEIRFADGNVRTTETRVTEQIMSKQNAAILSAMLVNVVEKGYGSGAHVDGFYVAGKTGTAQVAGKNGKYSDDTIHSFTGFGPISDPKFVIMIKLDKPKWGRFSSETVTPVFADMAKFLLQYYQIPPER